jgi:hypothetical protein
LAIGLEAVDHHGLDMHLEQSLVLIFVDFRNKKIQFLSEKFEFLFCCDLSGAQRQD